MQLEQDYYRFSDAARILGITRFRLRNLQNELGFETKTKRMDRREKWLSADTIRMIHNYLNSFE